MILTDAIFNSGKSLPVLEQLINLHTVYFKTIVNMRKMIFVVVSLYGKLYSEADSNSLSQHNIL